ncbi:MAG: tetratricopeptide repeat protein [Anaerolineae bacterium]
MPELYQAELRHARYYLNRLRTLNHAYHGAGERTRYILDEFDLDWHQIQHGQHWAKNHLHIRDAALICSEYPEAGRSLLSLRQSAQTNLEWADAGLQAARLANDRQREAANHSEMGKANHDLGAFKLAVEHYQQAIAIVRELGDQASEGIYENHLGRSYSSLGMYEAAVGCYETALRIARSEGSQIDESSSLQNLGLVYTDLTEYPRALDYHHQALDIIRRIGERRQEGNELGNLAWVYSSMGQYREALEHYQAALTIAVELGDRRGESNRLGNMGMTYRNLGDFPRAVECHEKALEIAYELGDKRGISIRLGNLALAYHGMGQYPQVIQYYERGLSLAREIGDRRGECFRLGGLGHAWHDLGEYEKALAYQQEGLELARKIGMKQLEGHRFAGLARTCIALERYDRALEYALEALAIAQKTNNASQLQSRLMTLAQIHLHQNTVKQAQETIRQACEYDATDNNYQVYTLSGIINLAAGDEAAAASDFARAVVFADQNLQTSASSSFIIYAKAVSLSGLAILSLHEERALYLILARVAFSAAYGYCHEVGIVGDAERLLALMLPVDRSGVLLAIRPVLHPR